MKTKSVGILLTCLALLCACSDKSKSANGYELVWQMRFASKPKVSRGQWAHFRRQYQDTYSNNQHYLGLRKNSALLYDEIFSTYVLAKQNKLVTPLLPAGIYEIETVLATRTKQKQAALLCAGRGNCQSLGGENRYQKSRLKVKLETKSKIFLQALASNLLVGAFRVYSRGRPQKQPNIIFIISDTTRSDALSLTNPGASTPHLDALAKKGVSFSRAYSNANWTRAALTPIFTGKHNYQLGINTLFFEISDLEKSLHKKSSLPFSVLAQKAGLTTIAVMDNIFALEYTGIGIDQGFAEVYNIARDGKQAAPITEKSIELIQKYKDRPFMLFVHHNNAHKPYTPPAEFLARIKNPTEKFANDKEYRKYLASVSFIDSHVGKLLKAVEQAGIAENTVIVFTSDHGEVFDKKHDFTFYHVYSGIHSHGETLYNEELSVPLIIFNPREGQNGQVIKKPVQTKDLYFYFTKLLNKNYQVDSWLTEHNQTPFLAEGRMAHAFIDKEHKYIVHAPGYNRLRQGYYGQQTETKSQYFDLINDPLEHTSLANKTKIKASFVAAQKSLIKQLATYTLQIPAGGRSRLTSLFGFYHLESNCPKELGIQYPPMPSYRPKLSWVRLANLGAKECQVKFSPYPFHTTFQIQNSNNLALQIGPLSLHLRRLPTTAAPQFWRAFYSPHIPENLDNTLPALWANQAYLSEGLNRSKAINAEVHGILKSWGYVQ